MSAKPKAFTVVELLVVIAVIAILTALLLPALSSATRQANKLKDMANLAEIQKALTLWKGEANYGKYPVVYKNGQRQWPEPGFVGDTRYKQYFDLNIPVGSFDDIPFPDPPTEYRRDEIREAFWFGFAGMAGFPDDPLNPGAHKYDKRRILDKYLISHEVLRSPADHGVNAAGVARAFEIVAEHVDTGAPSATIYANIYRGSYVYNPCLGIVDAASNKPVITDANIVRPEMTVTFADANIMDFLDDDGPLGPDDKYWHRAGHPSFCAAFADGHTEEVECYPWAPGDPPVNPLFGKSYKLDPRKIAP